jgi:hypothetical protein
MEKEGGGDVKWMEKLTGKNIIAKRVNKAGVYILINTPLPFPPLGERYQQMSLGRGGGMIFEKREENKGKM